MKYDWIKIGCLSLIDETYDEYKKDLGLIKATYKNEIVFLGAVTDKNNGIRKRLRDFTRKNSSARDSKNGHFLYENKENIQIEILILNHLNATEINDLKTHFKKEFNYSKSNLNSFLSFFTGKIRGTTETITSSNINYIPDYKFMQYMKRQLNIKYNNKCVYCETKLDKLSFVMDSYRPKNKYNWLINEESNYLLSCHACNRSKTDKFKTIGKKVVSRQDDPNEWKVDSKSFLLENALMLHPDIDPINENTYFTKDGFIHPINNNEKAIYTINVCSLNRESLVERRKFIIESIFSDLKAAIVQFNTLSKSDVELDYLVNILFKTVFDKIKDNTEKDKEFSNLYIKIFSNISNFFNDSFNEYHQNIIKYAYDFIINNKKGTFNLGPAPYLIKNVTTNLFTKEEDQLNYTIKQVEIENFQGVKKTSLTNIPTDTQWIFLTGENGFGKTSILKSIVLGLNGKVDNDVILSNDDCNIGLEIKSKDSIQINNLGANDFKIFKNFVAYGSSRLRMQNNESDKKTAVTYSLFNDDGCLLNIETLLKRYAFREQYEDKFNNIKEILCSLMPNINNIEVKEKGGKDIVLYIEKDITNTEYEGIEFKSLASGYKSIIAMFGDMIIRLSKTQDIESPKDLEGIAIIDELDIHFHPKWQHLLPKLLTEAFPKIQFIVSTHSIMPILGSPENSIFIKVTRNSDVGVLVDKIDIDVKNLLPNTILTSPIFDIDNLVPNANIDISNIRTESTYEDVIKNNEIKDRLNKFEEGNDEFPDDLFNIGE